MATTMFCLSVGSPSAQSPSRNTAITSDTSVSHAFEEYNPSEPEHGAKDFGREHETARCECTTVKQFFTNIDGDFFCTACKHEQCYLCTEYNDDNHSILSDEGQGNEEGEELWRIHDDEADVAIARVKQPNVPVSSIVELGTNDINFVTAAFDAKRLKSRLENISNECKLLIAFESLKWSGNRPLSTSVCWLGPPQSIGLGIVLKDRTTNKSNLDRLLLVDWQSSGHQVQMTSDDCFHQNKEIRLSVI
ncbi:hypothetical protein ONS95_009175 [Cadophora gregata]|uniref:uncharacterized protein n=1 Tax=Cadophora gregata TaxID=51156 RepID=UPI0026DB5CC9|nr:uncharacterized protein ONS95_009175 [Cadophora gregata]KAK0124194.1 hypothetical protein ONS95_009175 [Cadophora gregata]KAK0129949.1 hypothetical protein ONS96_000491 [Cadophora gregata f. sp. sojae]